MDSLGSDHCLLRITLLAKAAHKKGPGQIDRTLEIPILFSGGYAEWAKHLDAIQQQLVTALQTTEEIPAVDIHLLHLWEACRNPTKRWKKQKLNHKLKARIIELWSKPQRMLPSSPTQIA